MACNIHNPILFAAYRCNITHKIILYIYVQIMVIFRFLIQSRYITQKCVLIVWFFWCGFTEGFTYKIYILSFSFSAVTAVWIVIHYTFRLNIYYPIKCLIFSFDILKGNRSNPMFSMVFDICSYNVYNYI